MFEIPLFALWMNNLSASVVTGITAIAIMAAINPTITLVSILPCIVVAVIAFLATSRIEKYRIAKLLDHRAAELRSGHRLILIGYGNFRQHHRHAHERMMGLGIPHGYRDGPERKHDWHSGWVKEAVELLFNGQSGDGQESSRSR